MFSRYRMAELSRHLPTHLMIRLTLPLFHIQEGSYTDYPALLDLEILDPLSENDNWEDISRFVYKDL